MAETTHSKRQREEEKEHYQFEEEEDNTKRYKSSSYSQILSLLEEEEDEPNKDLLDIFQSLQQELSSDASSSTDPLQISASSAVADHQSGVSAALEESSSLSSDEDDDRLRMMRHLLEASDDELGLPSRSESGEGELHQHNPLFLGDGLWEFEDDAANYYTLLQSELFM
ncbi:hypothetical protein ACH5RR_030546 [Cinchona calisaya]|uniref:Uncharacterized protein n=1 Tax=Cinchona calisaya TaxID=153742 RepID=A0ABD2YUX6_9GENT